MSTLRIFGGSVVADYGTVRADLVIEDGRIAALSEQSSFPAGAADEEIDATGLHVLPGAVDVHTHLEDLQTAHREDFLSGTQAAAAGGVTTVIEHPLSTPATLTGEAFRDKRAVAQQKVVVDFGLWGALTPESLEHMADQRREGALGFKAFMADPGVSNFRSVDTAQLLEGLRTAKRLNSLVLVHAEDDSIIRAYREMARSRAGRTIRDFIDSRPAIAEEEAAARAILLAERTGTRLQIVHVSLPEVAERVAAARRRGLAITMEVCSHHLLLDRDDAERIGPNAICAPPLRPRNDVERLWEYVRGGIVDCLISDHSPYTSDEKAVGDTDAFAAGVGCQVLQDTVPLTLSAWYHERKLSLPAFARMASGRPAQILGLYPRKGTILPGSDADLMLVDLDARWTIRAADQHFSKHKWTPFEGLEARARVVRTLVRGRTVYTDGSFHVEPGYGQFLTAP